MSFVSQIMRKASIVERSEQPLDQKAKSYLKLAEEAKTIVTRMESSFARLTANEMDTLGPGRHKEIEQLAEAMSKLKLKASDALKRVDGKPSDTVH